MAATFLLLKLVYLLCYKGVKILMEFKIDNTFIYGLDRAVKASGKENK